jgi:hypothetical protein
MVTGQMLSERQETCVVGIAWLCYQAGLAFIFLFVFATASLQLDADFELVPRWSLYLLFGGIWFGFSVHGWAYLMALYRRYLQPSVLKC